MSALPLTPGTIIVEAERNPRINASAQCHTDGARERSRFALALRMSMSAMTATAPKKPSPLLSVTRFPRTCRQSIGMPPRIRPINAIAVCSGKFASAAASRNENSTMPASISKSSTIVAQSINTDTTRTVSATLE